MKHPSATSKEAMEEAKVIPSPSAVVSFSRSPRNSLSEACIPTVTVPYYVPTSGGGTGSSNTHTTSAMWDRMKKELPKRSALRSTDRSSKRARERPEKTVNSVASLPTVTGELGWGPEAYKYFPQNFVSSPDRYFRRLKRERCLQEKQGKEH